MWIKKAREIDLFTKEILVVTDGRPLINNPASKG